MPKKQTLEEFIQKALVLHGNKYDYSKVDYIDSKTKIIVICQKHGDFSATPKLHIAIRRGRGDAKPSGCPSCGEEQRRSNDGKSSIERTKSVDQFIKDAIEVHGEKYQYSRVNYQNSHTKIIITCPKHGDFEQKPYSHLNGRGCPACGQEIVIRTAEKKTGVSTTWSQKSFIEECKRNHNNKYDYSGTVFKTTNRVISIVCPLHGKFEQIAYDHLRGRGCEKCGRALIGLARRMSFEEWRTIADHTHKHNYEYDSSSYVSSKYLIKIKCKKHGWFTQKAGMHAYAGHGCDRCGNESIASFRKRTLKQFIKQAHAVHGDEYDYRDVANDKETGNIIYDSKGKITIKCKEHGPFTINPNNHIHLQQGCPSCVATKGEVRVKQYLELNQIKYMFQWIEHDCMDKGKLRFDFYLPEQNTVIEFDGQQHFMPVNFTGSMSEEEMNAKFEDVLRRDGIKEEWCHVNGIRLVRIPYTDDVVNTLTKSLDKK
jgi:very-short-patch-repair endonuclease